MNTELLRSIGNMSQLAEIRRATLSEGTGKGLDTAQFRNAAGLAFTVIPGRCMDIYDLSYRGINLSFLSKAGLTHTFSPMNGEFSNQWAGGALVTCGLDNVGGHCTAGGETFPTHGRIGAAPASSFGTESFWDGGEYILRASGEMHQASLFGRNLTLRRRIETTLYGKAVKVRDEIINSAAEAEPYMLLYHCNFGYPLLRHDSAFAHSPAELTVLSPLSGDPGKMSHPIDGREEELYLWRAKGERSCGILYNLSLGLGVAVSADTAALPNFLEWKRMKSGDYVLAIEPCNTCGMDRKTAAENGVLPVIPPFSSVTAGIEITVLDGESEINGALRQLG